MTRIVGTGCALSAVVAASCALPGAALGQCRFGLLLDETGWTGRGRA
ncbi:hydroxyethylthiazole kinase [Salmonella enterica subsp. enterica]|uniref:Hydroxyethylthiazole kinase n=1 Tax=Salmonella enterica I TaxID=59201 RepID=A0A379WQK3_SALET|nr:hydroxyethylthiazole kinase [Salmonella enterica subsp. enterica]